MDCGPPFPLSMGFSRQEHWTGFPFPSPGDLPNPGNSHPLHLHWQVGSLPKYWNIPVYSLTNTRDLVLPLGYHTKGQNGPKCSSKKHKCHHQKVKIKGSVMHLRQQKSLGGGEPASSHNPGTVTLSGRRVSSTEPCPSFGWVSLWGKHRLVLRS